MALTLASGNSALKFSAIPKLVNDFKGLQNVVTVLNSPSVQNLPRLTATSKDIKPLINMLIKLGIMSADKNNKATLGLVRKALFIVKSLKNLGVFKFLWENKDAFIQVLKFVLQTTGKLPKAI